MKKWISANDIIALIGLGMLFAGLSMWDVRIALTVTGGVLLIIAFLPVVLVRIQNGNNKQPV
jgi:hypothetical membrane protein